MKITLRVYKRVFPNGYWDYAFSDGEPVADIYSTSLTVLAVEMRRVINDMNAGGQLNNVHGVSVGISFTSIHDVECPGVGKDPRKCIRLLDKEQETFWRYFSKE